MFFKTKCPRCGAKNDKARTACIECGAPLPLAEKAPKERAEDKYRGNEKVLVKARGERKIQRKGWFWVGVGLLASSVVWWVVMGTFLTEQPPDFEGAIFCLAFGSLLTGIGAYCLRRGRKPRVGEEKGAESILTAQEVERDIAKRKARQLAKLAQTAMDTMKDIKSQRVVASHKVGFRRRVDFTDRGIRVKGLIKEIYIPYASIWGCTLRGPLDFGCIVKYVDSLGRDKEAKLAHSVPYVSASFEIYAHILRICDQFGQKVIQYPDPKMVRWAEQAEYLGVECEFIEPNVAYNTASGSGDLRSWQRDLGGYILQNPSINMTKVRETGTASYQHSTGPYGGGGGWVSRINYNFDYVVKVSSVPRIACTGSPIKKFRVRTVGYNWGGTTLAQILNDDVQLREMLVKAKAPAIELKENHILVTHNRFPSERLFRCLERIADHVRREVGW